MHSGKDRGLSRKDRDHPPRCQSLWVTGKMASESTRISERTKNIAGS